MLGLSEKNEPLERDGLKLETEDTELAENPLIGDKLLLAGEGDGLSSSKKPDDDMI